MAKVNSKNHGTKSAPGSYLINSIKNRFYELKIKFVN